METYQSDPRFAAISQEIVDIPNDLVNILLSFVDFSPAFRKFQRDTARKLYGGPAYIRCHCEGMLSYAHYMGIEFFKKPKLALNHLRVVDHIRRLWHSEVYHCRYDEASCGECLYCLCDKHPTLVMTAFDGHRLNTLDLNYDVVQVPSFPDWIHQINEIVVQRFFDAIE